MKGKLWRRQLQQLRGDLVAEVAQRWAEVAHRWQKYLKGGLVADLAQKWAEEGRGGQEMRRTDRGREGMIIDNTSKFK